MKLTKSQQDILDKMANGWELAQSSAIGGRYRCWIQQGGAGRGGQSETVSFNTVRALLNRNLIAYGKWSFPTRVFKLVGKEKHD